MPGCSPGLRSARPGAWPRAGAKKGPPARAAEAEDLRSLGRQGRTRAEEQEGAQHGQPHGQDKDGAGGCRRWRAKHRAWGPEERLQGGRGRCRGAGALARRMLAATRGRGAVVISAHAE